MRMTKRFQSIALALGTAALLSVSLVPTAFTAEEKTDRYQIPAVTPQINPNAERRDPHWRPGGSSSGVCSGVDLTVTDIEIRSERSGIFARAKIRNRCSGATERGTNVTFDGPGGGISIDLITPGWAGPVEFWTGWYGIPGNSSLRPFPVTVRVDTLRNIRETDEGNNSRTERLE